jgi:hypothetical protein
MVQEIQANLKKKIDEVEMELVLLKKVVFLNHPRSVPSNAHTLSAHQ